MVSHHLSKDSYSSQISPTQRVRIITINHCSTQRENKTVRVIEELVKKLIVCDVYVRKRGVGGGGDVFLTP